MGQMGGFADAQIQMSKAKNFSHEKLFVIHMAVGFLLKNRQKFIRPHFHKSLKENEVPVKWI